MDKHFVERLAAFLCSECSDYGLSYGYKWDADSEWCTVTIRRLDYESEVAFRYDVIDDDLKIGMTEDCWETTREFDQTVKYFWMLVSRDVFPN